MTDKPTVTQAVFEREERFIVIKRKHLTKEQELGIRNHLQWAGIHTVECAVVESDWPEYETVWKLIEDRVTGITAHREAAIKEAVDAYGITELRDAYHRKLSEQFLREKASENCQTVALNQGGSGDE